MPMRYRIDAERGMLFIEAEGETTQAERFEAMQACIRDPDFRPGLQTQALAWLAEDSSMPSPSE
jgi:hypothetical protein